MWRMLDKSASDLGNCSPIFLSCRSLASQCVCSSWEQGALDTHNSVMLSSFWPWGFQPWSKKELFQKNFARLPTPSFFLTNSTSTFIFTTISAFGGFFFFSDCTTMPLSQPQLWLHCGYFHFQHFGAQNLSGGLNTFEENYLRKARGTLICQRTDWDCWCIWCHVFKLLPVGSHIHLSLVFSSTRSMY